MASLAKAIFIIAAASVLASCSVGDDKCGKGFVEKFGACAKVTATGGRTSVAPPDADLDALGEENQTVTITGLGDACKNQNDCAEKSANYCAIDPTNGIGVCSIKDCTVSPNSCPGEYRCCKLPALFKFPPICIPPDKYAYATGMGYCFE
jgi:hypothetical protein